MATSMKRIEAASGGAQEERPGCPPAGGGDGERG
jgi:hypothetical protein